MAKSDEAGEDHPRVHRVQAAQLHHDEGRGSTIVERIEMKKYCRARPRAHRPQGDPLAATRPGAGLVRAAMLGEPGRGPGGAGGVAAGRLGPGSLVPWRPGRTLRPGRGQ